MTNDLAIIQPLPPALLQRRAIVYVRQSTQSQVMTNLEGQRRQYDLVETARTYGFTAVDVNKGIRQVCAAEPSPEIFEFFNRIGGGLN